LFEKAKGLKVTETALQKIDPAQRSVSPTRKLQEHALEIDHVLPWALYSSSIAESAARSPKKHCAMQCPDASFLVDYLAKTSEILFLPPVTIRGPKGQNMKQTASLDITIPNQPLALGNYVAGQWQPGSGESFSIMSPYSGTVIGKATHSTKTDVDSAVAGAKRASVDWGKTPIKERSQIMFKFREILLRDIAAISHSVSLESGKTLAEARAGLLKGVEVLEFALSIQNLEETGRMEVSRGVFCEYRREPLGVVAGITPFNFPAMVPMWMIPIAITAGNSFVWKPSDKTPLTSFLIANALKEAGLPAGVLTVIQGGKTTVEAILDHPDISAIGFVGSSPVARSVYTRATSHGKRALALGGAKNHIILMPDADIEMASRGIVDSFTGCAGQRCMAASVLIAVKGSEPILEEIFRKAATMRLGSEMGAIITQLSRDSLKKAIDHSTSDGAKIAVDGRPTPAPGGFEGGYWLAPTILDQVRPGTQAATDELFGPILSVIRAQNVSEALAIENKNRFGNAASVFTSSGAIAERVVQETRAGMVGINIGVPVPREPFSFGGTQESKFGNGDITGIGGLNFWTTLKKVTTKWMPSTDKNWMN
jgi:malonate-semialdehyde dehydrogenase (acetylating)/methylmalonate-semialdehyde dehydrogenase